MAPLVARVPNAARPLTYTAYRHVSRTCRNLQPFPRGLDSLAPLPQKPPGAPSLRLFATWHLRHRRTEGTVNTNRAGARAAATGFVNALSRTTRHRWRRRRRKTPRRRRTTTRTPRTTSSNLGALIVERLPSLRTMRSMVDHLSGATAARHTAAVRPGRCCSPRHKVPLHPRNKGSKCVVRCGEHYLPGPTARGRRSRGSRKPTR